MSKNRNEMSEMYRQRYGGNNTNNNKNVSKKSNNNVSNSNVTSVDSSKADYSNLGYSIRSIRDNLNILNENYVQINNSLKNNVIIDKKTIGEDNLNNMKSTVDSIIYEINNSILPIINNNS